MGHSQIVIGSNISEICTQQGIANFVISPGSRSAPLTVALARQPNIRCRVVMDERAAAFIALGIAQQTRLPVGLVCTSGTAGLNYAPAVTEAFYQRIPLLVFTADRPPEWIDQQDGQTMRQPNLYGSHTRGRFQLPVDYSHPDARWHLERTISEAINTAKYPLPGPVHINVPLREPLYPPPDQVVAPQLTHLPIHLQSAQPTLSPEIWQSLDTLWQHADRKLILAGLHPPNVKLSRVLTVLGNDPSVAIIGDLTANIHQAGMQFAQWDMCLSTKSETKLAALMPELLITYGGQIVSKAVKQVLRKYRPREHWHIDPAGQTIDTFQSLTSVIPTDTAYFFTNLAERSKSGAVSKFAAAWQVQQLQAQQRLMSFLTEASFGEFKAIAQVMQALPEPSLLQLGNSMPVRYANYLGLASRNIRVNANRGTSGIDGTVSTAVGAALAADQIVTLIVGDLGFFYDRNALWHNHLPPNLRIVILNNHGGGIFKLIDGPSNLPETELVPYFETPHPLTAKNTAADHGCAYFHCDSFAGLQQHLSTFFRPGLGPAILEIETDSAVNTQVFQQFKKVLGQ